MKTSELTGYVFPFALAVLGLALLYWSRPLALRYNTWTTKLRERSKLLSQPPTERMAALNLTVTVILIRIIAIVFLALAWWGLTGNKFIV